MNISIGNRDIFLSESLLENLSGYRQTGPKSNESGGILLGQILNTEVFILKNSPPSDLDKSSRYSFTRDKGNAQKIIDCEFKESGGKMIYLGEWHTHPEDVPNPSFQDIRMIKEQFKKNKLNEPFVILMIQGLKKVYLGIYDGVMIQSVLI